MKEISRAFVIRANFYKIARKNKKETKDRVYKDKQYNHFLSLNKYDKEDLELQTFSCLEEN